MQEHHDAHSGQTVQMNCLEEQHIPHTVHQGETHTQNT